MYIFLYIYIKTKKNLAPAIFKNAALEISREPQRHDGVRALVQVWRQHGRQGQQAAVAIIKTAAVFHSTTTVPKIRKKNRNYSDKTIVKFERKFMKISTALRQLLADEHPQHKHFSFQPFFKLKMINKHQFKWINHSNLPAKYPRNSRGWNLRCTMIIGHLIKPTD